MKEFTFELGEHLQDVVTGFKGHTTWRVEFLTGCDQYGLQPKGFDEKGQPHEAKQFDENRLIPTGEDPIVLPSLNKNKSKKLASFKVDDSEDRGGPNDVGIKY